MTFRGRSFWERSTVGWHITFCGLLAVMAVIVFIDGSLEKGDRLAALGLLAGMLAMYAFVGSRALGGFTLVRSLVYLGAAWLVVGLMAAIVPDAFLLLLIVAPQTWAMLPLRWALGVNATGTAWLVGVQLLAGTPLGEVAAFGVINLTISVLLGFWINGIVAESDKRADLIEELERTRAELAASEHDRGAMAERQRLANEIHDTLAQGFTSVLALAQAAEVSLDRDPAKVRRALTMLQGAARDNLAEARALVGALTPPDLENSTLADAVGRVVTRFADEAGVDAVLTVEGPVRALSPGAEVVLLRVAQEALTNVRRHAKATSVAVHLSYDGDRVGLEISDDGRGFDQSQPAGHGLRGMRTRLEQLGGALAVRSLAGSGTTVAARLP